MGKYAVHISNRGRKYKTNAVLEMMAQNVVKGGTQRYEVSIDAYPPDRRKRDLDNILKPLLDCMEDYGVFQNDEQIDILTVRRRAKGGYVIIHVSEIPEIDSLVA